MISQRIRGVEALYVTLQAAIIIALYWLWLGMLGWLSPSYQGVNLPRYNAYCLFLVLGLVGGNLRGVREALYDRSILEHLPAVLRQTTWSIGALLFFLFITKDTDHVSRAFVLSFAPALYFALLMTSWLMPRFILWISFRDIRQENTLLVGSCRRIAHLAPWLRRKARFGLRTVGVLCDEDHAHYSPAQCPVLGPSSILPRAVSDHRVTQVLFMEFNDDTADFVEPVQRAGARMLIVSDLAERLGHSISIFEDDGLHFVALHAEPLENPLNRVLKRAYDIVFSLLIILLVLPPLAVLVWILHRLQSPGPLFYRQTRAGIQNREFTILKFRSMHAGEAKGDGTDTARLFPAGRFLRRYSLDEFPQFLNVLRGEMSVVGPRPHMVEHNTQFAEVMSAFHIRTFVKPGITGLAQVRGFRGEARTVDAVAHRLESDMIYLENWSPFLDLMVILRTVWQVIFPPDAAR